jgi:lysophospholipase L1-like esterase
MDPTPVAASHELSRRKKLLFVAVIAVGLAVFLELGVRLVFAARVGPSVLLYGTPFHRDEAAVRWEKRSVTRHENQAAGYSKYFPNQTRQDRDPATGEYFSVGINGRGFRGPDFAEEKAPGTRRVLTLGGSSTFGYTNRDEDTYPSVLQHLLDARCPGTAFEVINLGIPHQGSGEILALFEAEGAPLAPDLVSFYEGANDTVNVPGSELRRSLKSASLARTLLRELRARLLTLVFIDSFLDTRMRRFGPDDVARHTEGKVDAFLGNLAILHDSVSASGAHFVVANQQVKSMTLSDDEILGVSYAAEVASVRRSLQDSGGIGASAQWMLIHSELMDALEPWAREREIPFVDVIGRLDPDRRVLVSWVHLSPSGNRQIAEALAEQVLALLCAGGGSPASR